ncbi:MAG TPA: FtsX-like permease family protein, partial [Agriterribacter sp.]|nr:FtsX-like permease family protein [Agriterribacter sp.]
DGDRVFRILVNFNQNGKEETDDSWPAPMAAALVSDFPEVEKSGRFMGSPLFDLAGSNQVRRSDVQQNTYEEGFAFADQSMLDILKMPMIYGKREQALSEPNTVVISKSKAEKYFPGQNPVGKTLVFNNDTKNTYTIGGVMVDFPVTSYLKYDFLLTMTGHQLWDDEQTNWGASNYPTYVLLKKGVDTKKFEKKLELIKTKYYLPLMRQAGLKELEEMIKKAKLFMQPIGDVYLHSADVNDHIQKGDIRYVWLFGAIAIFILLIASVNFINLATAKSANRAKEVGLRKVVGSLRNSLVAQFLTESLLYSLISFSLGLLLAVLFLPAFESFSATTISVPWREWWFLPSIVGAVAVVGILAGLYPSFYLSSFRPIEVLKGHVSRGSKNSYLRNGLVVFQFATSIILIIGTIVIYNQTHLILNRKVGFDKDQVLLIQGSNTLGEKQETFKNELLRSSEVKKVTIGDYYPIANTKRDGNTFYREGKKTEGVNVPAQKWQVDIDYIKTMGMHLLEGRDFSKELASDSQATIINKAMQARLGLQNPIGEKIENGWQKFTVIGVMEDFNYETMREKVQPLCLVLGKYNSSMVAVKVGGSDVKAALGYVSTLWKQYSPNQPFRYTFLDESFARMYDDVQRSGNIFTAFAILAIIIACLGLFALSAYMAEQRSKEIGIRKVLGASVAGITTMLSKDFVKLVLLSLLIATPIAWWMMTKWLEDFAYRVNVSWWIIAVAGIAAITIALITVSFQSIKAAIANPIKSLRTE